MSESERKLMKIWDAESRKPKPADGGLGHDELRDAQFLQSDNG